ncbi:hypothetical protein JG687_00017937 [Phytophthora cactorum]|uniref:Uncharacterized protein n=1 Tax=Phytophthora cactorum TaxID=29920 RepID=A0A8T1TNS2_9STRA|nr:hypothetical protein JG687_00017937 [Phytophthora cactorum]
MDAFRLSVQGLIKTAVPKWNGSQACLQFQTLQGCDFAGCKHLHELVQPPPEVFTHVTNKHGELKDAHPNLSS